MAAPKLRKPNVVEQFAIWNAIDKDNADGLQQIVNKKLNVNASLDELGYTGNWTPLHWAADYDSINCASLLISNFKCDINVTNKDGHTPLQLAINKKSYKVVYLLIAECNQQIFHLSQKDQDNATEMIEQYKRKHPEIISQPVTAASQQSVSKYASKQSPVTVTRQPAKSIGGHPIKDIKLLHKHVIPKISADWQTVAVYLGYSITDKKLIDATHKGDPRKCCIGLLEDWITSDKGVTPKTWEKLVEVLGEISSLAMVTKEIKQCLHQEGVLEDKRPSQQPQPMTSHPPVPATVHQQPHPTEKNLMKPEELKAMVSQKFFKDITPDSVEANELRGRTQILLLTANDYEYYAALAFLKPVEGDTLFRCQHQYTSSLAKVATYTFGRFGAFIAAIQMITFQGPAAAQEVITMAANFFGPNLNAIFSVGVACGVEKKNKLLDVLVSKSVSFYTVARYGTTTDGKLRITNRAIANLPTSNLLLQHFSNPPEWPVETSKIAKSLTETPKLHKGLFLSGDYLVDNKDFKYELSKNFAKEAIGIEMEGAGLYHDYSSHSYQILIVKAVCDFGDGKKNKDYQPTAALLAVECLHHYLSREALPKNLSDHCNKKGNTDVQSSISLNANQTEASSKENDASPMVAVSTPTTVQLTSSPNSSDEKEKKIPKEHLKYTVDDLKNVGEDSIRRFNNNIETDKKIIDSVVLLLMVVNTSEFLAAMYYFSKNEGRGLYYKKNLYYVGKWDKIPAALVQQAQQGTSGPIGSQELTSVSIELFANLKLIISLGVCGTMGRLGDVIVSSQIDGCEKYKVNGERQINRDLKYQPGSNIQNFLKKSANTWSFKCTKEGIEVYKAYAALKPMLSGCPLIASGEFRDELISSVNKEAGGVEMEGIGVVDGIEKAEKKYQIEFIIVKAGCDYADESKNKEWQPVAAMAAADFVYTGLGTKIAHEWILDDHEVIKRYLNQAKQCGYLVRLKHLTVLLVGTSGVGKTSFLQVLQGNDPALEHNPTDMKEHKKLMLPSKFGIKSDNRWYLLDEQAQMTEIFKRLRSKTLFHSNQHTTDIPELAHSTTTINDDVTLSIEDETIGNENHNAPSEDHEKMKHDHQIAKQNDIFTSSIKNEDYETSLDKKILNCSASGEPSDTWNIVTVIDTAGQPEFINLLPAINNLAKITFVIFDMESELKKEVSIKRGDKTDIKDNEKLHYSNLHALKYFISTITNSAQFDANVKHIDDSDKFQVCFIGTHYDKVVDNPNLCKDVDKEIEKMIKQCKLDDICFVWDDHGLVYKIDASKNYTKPGVKRDDTVAKCTIKAIEAIRKNIQEIFHLSTKHISTDISLNWLLLELLLQDKCKKSEMVYMERNKVTDLVREENLQMSSIETESALKYLHHTGILLYFHEGGKGLSDVVFPNTNDIFKRLTKVINCVHHKEGPTNRKIVDDLKSKGILHKKLLLNINLFKDEKEVDILLMLLEHLKIITLWTEQSKGDPENKLYFMPCVLPSYNLNKEDTAKNQSLLMHFEFGTVPRGLFCFLVVALLKENNVFSCIVGETLYNNLIKFQTTTKDIVKIIDWNNSLEITLEHNESKDEDFLSYRVQHDITYALTNVWKNFKLLTTDSSDLNSTDLIEYGFWCKPCEKKYVTKLPKLPYECKVCKYPIEDSSYKDWCKQCTKTRDVQPKRTYRTAKCSICNFGIDLQNEQVWFICKVSSFKITEITKDTVTLQWSSPILSVPYSKHELKYKKSTESTQISERICTSDLKVKEELATYTIKELSPDTSYQFKLSVVNELGMEGEDTEIEAHTAPSKPPSEPEKLTVDSESATHESLTLLWRPPNPSNVTITGYKLQYKKTDEEFQTLEELLYSNKLKYTVSGLTANTEYYFRVAAVNSAGCGSYKTTIDGQYTKPSEPEGLKAEQKDIINTTVTLSWKPPNPFNGSISEYIMEYKVINSIEQAPIKSVIKNTEWKVTDGLIAGKQYEFKVAAVNKAGPGPFTKPYSLHIKQLISQVKLTKMVENSRQFKDIEDEAKIKNLVDETKILLITANENENKAVLYFLQPRSCTEGKLLYYNYEFCNGFLKRTAVYTLGKYGQYNAAVHLMANQGPAAAQSAIMTAASCFEKLDAIFAVGVACGVKPKTDLLDVIVADTVTFYTDARISSYRNSSDEECYKIERRSTADLKTSQKYRQYFKKLPDWSMQNSCIMNHLVKQPRKHFGNVLSGNYLIDNKKIKKFLLENFAPKAIGIEMESAGLFHDYECGNHNVQIMLVKAVCDFGDGEKNKDYQPTAALLAAECVHHYLK